MAHQFLDDLIKEYLLFRGFNNSLRAFDADIKTEKEKSYRADRLVDQMLSLISNHDLVSLRELWQHLQSRLFKRLDPVQNGAALRLESGVLKLYLVNCVQTKRPEKIKEFFEKMAVELQGATEWRDWFALPFLQNPETHPSFQGHFSRQWQDTLLLSLHNFLALVFARLPAPRLSEFQSTATKLKRLREENDVLRQTLIKQRQQQQQAMSGVDNSTSPGVRFPDVGVQQRDLMDDFCIIAQQESATIQNSINSENQVKTLKSFLRNITGGTTYVGTPSPTTQSTNLLPPAGSERKVKRPSQEDGGSSARKPTPEPGSGKTVHTPLKRVAQSVPFANSDTASVTSADGRLAYLLLGQEEYKEHHSEITQCKFSGSGCVIGSSDIDGVVKIWSASPGVPHTLATFVSTCSVTSLDWLPNSDRHFVYGTSNGTVRLCDADERKVVTEMSTSRETGNGSGQSIQQLACSPNNGSVIAISTASNGDSSSEGSLMLYDIKSSTYLERDLTGSLSGSLAGIVPLMTTCLFNHNSQMLLTGATDGKIRIFDLRKRECISSWSVSGDDVGPSSKQNVLSLQLSHDETRIYALTGDGLFTAWSFVQTSQKLFGAPLDDPYFHEASQYPRSFWGKQFAFAGDGKHFLSCSTNGGVIYEVRSDGTVEKVLGLKGHSSHATSTDWSASNDCGPCVTAAVDGQIRVSTLLSQ